MFRRCQQETDGGLLSVEGSLLIHLNFMTPDLSRLHFQPPGEKKKRPRFYWPWGLNSSSLHTYTHLYVCMHSLVRNSEWQSRRLAHILRGSYPSLQVCTCEYVCETDRMADTRTTPRWMLLGSRRWGAPKPVSEVWGRREVEGRQSGRCGR